LAGLKIDGAKQQLMPRTLMLARASSDTMGGDSMHSDAIVMPKFM
jgi:hypothetical protein